MALAAGAVWLRPIAAAAQDYMPVIGFLSSRSPDESSELVTAFSDGLSETGYIAGQNVAIEYRWAEGRYEQLPALAADLVGRKVGVIFSTGGLPAALAAKGATTTIPIVFAMGGDPVGEGLVTSLARPGGNITGISFLVTELHRKRLELLSELVPDAKVIALLVNPNFPDAEHQTREVQEAAAAKGVQLAILNAATDSEIETAFASHVLMNAGALLVGGDAFFASRRAQLVGLATRRAVPAIYQGREFAAAGGLISYGSSFPASFRQAGVYVAKILHGAKPVDLPVQQPTKFELVINLKTAKALGVTVPQSLLARADEVIE
jgi:putative ABC transport system substrate-binding protein